MSDHYFECGTGSITITPTTVTIQHKKGTYHGGKQKDIQIKSISGIELKEPGRLIAGHISILFSGGTEAGGRKAIDAAKNENSLMISKKYYKDFLECKRVIQEYMNAPSESKVAVAATSDADELAKWVALRDSGVITEEEFTVKKKEIIGI
ncbi:SHOCT domain-containing protein [Terribacillus saccharophilus]|uniref:SHOCT domain-containing protein n=1 Tax=Terribacillus saccharophilus TaxID=361277 RepID=UPI0039826DC1